MKLSNDVLVYRLKKIIGVFCLLILFINCSRDPHRERPSSSLIFSKQHDLFINKYKPNPDYLCIEGHKITINEVWTDNGWEYSNYFGKIKKLPKHEWLNVTFKNDPSLIVSHIADYTNSCAGGMIWMRIRRKELLNDTIKLIYYSNKQRYETLVKQRYMQKYDEKNAKVINLIKVK